MRAQGTVQRRDGDSRSARPGTIAKEASPENSGVLQEESTGSRAQGSMWKRLVSPAWCATTSVQRDLRSCAPAAISGGSNSRLVLAHVQVEVRVAAAEKQQEELSRRIQRRCAWSFALDAAAARAFRVVRGSHRMKWPGKLTLSKLMCPATLQWRDQ